MWYTKLWCPIFYSAEARRTRSEFIGDSTVTGNHLPSGVCEGTAMAETPKLAASLAAAALSGVHRRSPATAGMALPAQARL
jgi:hypothetical protein